MGGGYISCGNFSGDDKSGSPITGILEDLTSNLADTQNSAMATKLLEQLDSETDHILIEPDQATKLLPDFKCLQTHYKSHYPDLDDWWLIFERETQQGLDNIAGKWGESIGWKIYCLADLIPACEISISTGEPITISFD
jgi:hypothetical protein